MYVIASDYSVHRRRDSGPKIKYELHGYSVRIPFQCKTANMVAFNNLMVAKCCKHVCHVVFHQLSTFCLLLKDHLLSYVLRDEMVSTITAFKPHILPWPYSVEKSLCAPFFWLVATFVASAALFAEFVLFPLAEKIRKPAVRAEEGLSLCQGVSVFSTYVYLHIRSKMMAQLTFCWLSAPFLNRRPHTFKLPHNQHHRVGWFYSLSFILYFHPLSYCIIECEMLWCHRRRTEKRRGLPIHNA